MRREGCTSGGQAAAGRPRSSSSIRAVAHVVVVVAAVEGAEQVSHGG